MTAMLGGMRKVDDIMPTQEAFEVQRPLLCEAEAVRVEFQSRRI
jgi:hypothetical protein